MNDTVTLIVTGKMEEQALATALNRAFSELSFSTKRLHGMTSVNFARVPTQSVKQDAKQDAVKVGCKAARHTPNLKWCMTLSLIHPTLAGDSLT